MRLDNRRLSLLLGAVVSVLFIEGLTIAWAAADGLDQLTRALGYASFVFWVATLVAIAASLLASRPKADEPSRATPSPHPESEQLATADKPLAGSAITQERVAAVLAGVALALFLAAVGAAVIPGGASAGSSKESSELAISWSVREPLRVRLPTSGRSAIGSPANEPPATVVFDVADPQHPRCDGEYLWTFEEEGTAQRALRRDGECDASLDVRPGDDVDVYVESGGRGGSERITVRRLLIVSFGDSVASGEGNPQDGHWEDASPCHRSAIAGPRQAAERIAALEHHAVVTFLHLACTGAWIDGVGAPSSWRKKKTSLLPTPGEREPRLSELTQFRRDRPASDGDSIVLLSIGANDLGFSKILRKCAKTLRGNCFDGKLDGTALRQLVPERFAALQQSFARLASTYPFTTPDVYLTEYFDPLRDEQGALCAGRRILGLSRVETEAADTQILRPLNALLQQTAQSNGWHFVGGLYDAFGTHGYCSSDAWIVGFLTSVVRRNLSGTFHPDAQGQREYGNRIYDAVAPNLPTD